MNSTQLDLTMLLAAKAFGGGTLFIKRFSTGNTQIPNVFMKCGTAPYNQMML